MAKDYSKVVVIYCPCGERWQTVGHPEVVDKKELQKAVINGQKIETISIEHFRENNEKFGCKEGCTHKN